MNKPLPSHKTDLGLARIVVRLLEKQHNDAKVIFASGSFYQFRGTHWVELDEQDIRRVLVEVHDELEKEGATISLSKNKMASVVDMCRTICAIDAPETFFKDPPAGVNAANGFLRIPTSGPPVLEPHHADQRQLAVWPYDYDPDYMPVIYRWDAELLHRLIDGTFKDDKDRAEREALFQEVCGCAAMGYGTSLAQPKALVLVGDPNSGKSQWLEVFKHSAPEGASAEISPENFHNEQYYMELKGKYVNTASELPVGATIHADAFKQVITGDRRTGKTIYKRPESVATRAQHIFGINKDAMPNFKGGLSGAVARRLLPLKLTRIIPTGEMIPLIGRRIAKEEGRALFHYAIEGASRLIRQGAFTVPPSSADLMAEWRRTTDQVAEWMEERVEYVPGERLETAAAYSDFAVWFGREGYGNQMPPRQRFGARVPELAPQLFGKAIRGGVRAGPNERRRFTDLRLKPMLPSPEGGVGGDDPPW